MAKYTLKDGREIDEEKEYDYTSDYKDFDLNFKENQDYWAEEPEKAHQRQERNVAAFDEVTKGESSYNPGTGVWNLSDGRKSSANGITGNSYLSRYFDRKKTDNYQKREAAREEYFGNKFSYDPEADEVYQRYKKQYILGAQAASDDAVARSAIRTGGLASSYATTAGALAYQEQMQHLSDKIPELSALAYQKWEDEQARLREKAEMYDEGIDEEYSDWSAGRSAYLQMKDTEKADAEEDRNRLVSYRAVLSKAQTEGISALSDSERELLYYYDSYYDPTKDEIIDVNGQNYELGIRKSKEEEEKERLAREKAQEKAASDAADQQNKVAAILFKARNAKNGAASLSVSELTTLINAGYTVSGGTITGPSGDSYQVIQSTSSKGTSSKGTSSKSTSSKTSSGLSGSSGGTKTIGDVTFTERQEKAKQALSGEDGDILQGMTTAWTNTSGGNEAKSAAVEAYLDSLGFAPSQKAAYINKFVSVYS